MTWLVGFLASPPRVLIALIRLVYLVFCAFLVTFGAVNGDPCLGVFFAGVAALVGHVYATMAMYGPAKMMHPATPIVTWLWYHVTSLVDRPDYNYLSPNHPVDRLWFGRPEPANDFEREARGLLAQADAMCPGVIDGVSLRRVDPYPGIPVWRAYVRDVPRGTFILDWRAEQALVRLLRDVSTERIKAQPEHAQMAGIRSRARATE